MYHPLSNTEIQNLLSAHPATKKIYKGFLFPRDRKRPKISPPALYILNTDYAQGEGIHWILIYFLKNKTINVLHIWKEKKIVQLKPPNTRKRS